MPGVDVTSTVRTGPTGVVVAPASSWFVVGTSERGPVDQNRLVTSLAEFETWFGGYSANTTLHPHVQTFFEEGGARCYVARTVGASTSNGSLTLMGTGSVPAISLTAASPGAWSSGITVAVTASGTFTVRVYYNGVILYTSPPFNTAAQAVAAINSSPALQPYVTADTLSGDIPLVAVSATMSAGLNGSTPNAAQYVAALSLHTNDLGAGAVSIPEQFGTTIYNGIIAHAVANSRIAILGFDPALDADGAISASSVYATAPGAEYTQFLFPHVKIPGTGGTTLTISPESYAAAKRSIAHNQGGGPWVAGAGLISQADFLTGLARNVDKATGDRLDQARVNAIRIILGTIRIYGARSISSDEENFRYITYRDLLNYLLVEAERQLEDLVFSNIDGRGTVFGRTEARLIGLLEPIRRQGGLYEAYDVDGNQLDPGYSVTVNDTLNPVAQLATGLVRAKVGVRVSSVGDRLEITVVKSNLTSSVV